MAEIHDQFDTILILDFGSQVCLSCGLVIHSENIEILQQYSHLITRRCREHNVYAELMPCTTLIKDVHFKPKGLKSLHANTILELNRTHRNHPIGITILGL